MLVLKFRKSINYKRKALFVAGRLDKDTEGLLLITNDGAFAHNMLAPKKHVDKTYFVKVLGKLSSLDTKMFEDGVVLEDGYKTMSAKLEILEEDDVSLCYLTIKEGKFHQVKRMFLSVGKKVLYLKRVKIGCLSLDENLKLGEVKKLYADDIKLIKASENKK